MTPPSIPSPSASRSRDSKYIRHPDAEAPRDAIRPRRAAGLLMFGIGVFIQLSMPMTDLYQIPNVRGIFFGFIIAAFIFLFLTGVSIRVGSPLLLSYLALSTFLAVGILYSRAPMYGTNKAIMTVAYFWALGTVIYNLVDDISSAKSFLNGLVVGGVLLIGITALTFGNPIDMIRGANRFFRLRFGEEGNPILLARHLALAITVFATYVAIRRRWIDILWSLPLSSLAFMYLIATGSKGPLVALIASFICTPILLVRGAMARISVAVVVGGVLLVGAIGVLAMLPQGFIQERFVEKVQNLSMRLPAYKVAMTAIMNSDPIALLVGHGTGDFGYLDLGKDARSYPHNVFLEITYENGLMGFCLLAFAFICPLLALMRVLKYRLTPSHHMLLAGLTASYIASVINAQFSGDLGANLFIGMLGAALTSIAHVQAQDPAYSQISPQFGAGSG